MRPKYGPNSQPGRDGFDRPWKAQAGPRGILACALIVMALLFAACQPGDLGVCPTWTAPSWLPFIASAGGGAAAAGCAAGSLQTIILGERQPFLPADALRRGIANFGSGERFEHLGHKLLAGQPITAAFVGGSVTWGQGGPGNSSFVHQFSAWLNSAFPHPGHRVINLGVPGITPAPFAACFNPVPKEPDLVVLEFAINEGYVAPRDRDQEGFSFNTSSRRSFEQLVRNSLKLQGEPAVALLNFFAWNITRDKVKADQGSVAQVGPALFWRTVEDDLTTTAQYYDVPALSLRNAVFHLMREGRPGFQTNVSLGLSGASKTEELKDTQFYWDASHPWARTGHRALAELVMAAVSRGVQTAANSQLAALAWQRPARLWLSKASAAAGEQLAPARLPPPMVAGNYEADVSSCHLQENFKAVIQDTDGFTYKARSPQFSDFVAAKWGLTSEMPGATATLKLDTQLGSASDHSETVQVHLAHLRSWNSMGRAEVACLSGCRCNAVQLDGHWERIATLTDLAMMQVTPHPECVLQVKLLNKTSSGKHRFIVSGAVVSIVTARMDTGTATSAGLYEFVQQ